MRVSEAASVYVAQLQGDGRSIHTTKQVARILRKLATELRDPGIDTVRHEDLAAFFAKRGGHEARGRRDATSRARGLVASE
jgi:hypothetical protein